MRVRIQHHTTYSYARPVVLGPHLLRLHPAAHCPAELLSYRLDVSPTADRYWQFDAWNNRICRLVFDDEQATPDTLSITVEATFALQPVNPFDFLIEPGFDELPFQLDELRAREFAPLLQQAPLDANTAEWLESIDDRGGIIEYLVRLNRRVATDLDYLARLEPGFQSPGQTLALRRGSCRDSAWLLCAALRAKGIVSRFVSGYLVQLREDDDSVAADGGVREDSVDLHAWAEAYVPGAGWIGLDGTSGLLCTEGHIPLAAATHPLLAAPVDGTFARAKGVAVEASLGHTMHVTRVQ